MIAFYLLLLLLVGYVVLSLVHPDRIGLAEAFGLTAVLGAGTTGVLLFGASLMGFTPSPAVLAIIAATALAGLLRLKKKNRLVRFAWPTDLEKRDAAVIVPVIVAIVAVVAAAFVHLSFPLYNWDAFSIWGLKAKVLSHAALRPVPAYFHDLTLSYSHLDYPLMVPFLTAGAYGAIGTVQDQAGKVVSIFFAIALLPLLYSGLRWKLRRAPAAVLTAMAALLPMILLEGDAGCADVALTTFYAGSIVYAARWIAERAGKDLLLALLLSAFAVFTKKEGTALALINGVTLLVFGVAQDRRRGWKGAALFFAGVLAINAAWLIWSHSLPRTHENYESKLVSPLLVTNLPRLKPIISAMAGQAVDFRTWGFLWIVAGVLALTGWRAVAYREVKAMWVLLALHLMTYVVVYVVTPWDLARLLATTVDRLLLHTIPAVLILAGWHWAEALGSADGSSASFNGGQGGEFQGVDSTSAGSAP